MEVQKGAAELRPCCRNILLPFHKSRMKTSSEEAVGKGQQCVFVSLIKKQHPGEVLSAVLRRGAPWPGLTQLLVGTEQRCEEG